MRTVYFRVPGIVSLLLVSLGSYAVGIRGDNLLWTVLLLVVPVQVILLNISIRLFAPDLELTGEFRGILYGDPEAESLDERDSTVTAPNE
jgi:hypothetical protein